MESINHDESSKLLEFIRKRDTKGLSKSMGKWLKMRQRLNLEKVIEFIVRCNYLDVLKILYKNELIQKENLNTTLSLAS